MLHATEATQHGARGPTCETQAAAKAGQYWGCARGFALLLGGFFLRATPASVFKGRFRGSNFRALESDVELDDSRRFFWPFFHSPQSSVKGSSEGRRILAASFGIDGQFFLVMMSFAQRGQGSGALVFGFCPFFVALRGFFVDSEPFFCALDALNGSTLHALTCDLRADYHSERSRAVNSHSAGCGGLAWSHGGESGCRRLFRQDLS